MPVDRQGRSAGYLRQGYKGSKQPRRVRREDDGTVGGTRTEHWSGRVDVNVTPRPVTLRSKKGT